MTTLNKRLIVLKKMVRDFRIDHGMDFSDISTAQVLISQFAPEELIKITKGWWPSELSPLHCNKYHAKLALLLIRVYNVEHEIKKAEKKKEREYQKLNLLLSKQP